MSSIGLVTPLQFPQYWDKVIIAGVTSPGLARLKEWKRAHDWDVKKGKGTLGATLTFTQKPPAEGQIEFLLWDDGSMNYGPYGGDHFTAWDNFVPLLKYDPTKKTADAVFIYHPSLDFLDIGSVVTTKIGNPVLVAEGEAYYSITVDFIEDYPTPAKNATSNPISPTGTVGPPTNPGGNPPPDAPDALQQQIASLLQDAQS